MTQHPHDSDVAFIQALAELLNANELTELSVKREYGDNDSLNVRGTKQMTVISQAAPAPAAMAPAPSGTASCMKRPRAWTRRTAS